jgi:hypothetical protein
LKDKDAVVFGELIKSEEEEKVVEQKSVINECSVWRVKSK